MCSHDDALAEELEHFQQNDPREMAENSGSKFEEQKNRFILEYCGHPFYVSYPRGEVWTDSTQKAVGEERVLFLQYLNWAISIPPRRQWVSFLELPGGELHFAPFQKEAIFPLAEKYGSNLEEFKKITRFFKETVFTGDASVIIPAFPRLEMAVIIWKQDEEYPARANLLFDITSTYHLPTASLYVLGILVVKRLFLK